jgi:hypothetical protein
MRKDLLTVAAAVLAGAALGALAQDMVPTPGATPPPSATPAPTPGWTPGPTRTPGAPPTGKSGMRRTPGSLDPARTPTPGGPVPDRTPDPGTPPSGIATITPTPAP